MDTMFSSVSGTTTTTVISTARANSHLVWSVTLSWCAMALSTSAARRLSSAATLSVAMLNCSTALPLMRLAIVAVS